MQNIITHKNRNANICNEWKSHLFHLIANEMLWRERKVNILKLVARILSKGIVCNNTVLIMHPVVIPFSHMPSFCVQGKFYIDQIVLTLSLYIRMCYFYDFLSLHSLGTWNVFVSFSSQNIVSLKIMFVSLLYMTYNMVLYCHTYQLFICINFVVTVTETDGQ